MCLLQIHHFVRHSIEVWEDMRKVGQPGLANGILSFLVAIIEMVILAHNSETEVLMDLDSTRVHPHFHGQTIQTCHQKVSGSIIVSK